MSNGRVTVRQVAALAGVSPATVSRVSRGSTQVDPELRERVLRVIEEHGYRPSHFGRALAERRHGALGLVFPGLSGPYFSELIQGFEAQALETGDSVLVLASHSRADTDATVIDLAGRVDGMAIHGGTVSDAALETVCRQIRVVVMAGETGPAYAAVRVDNGSRPRPDPPPARRPRLPAARLRRHPRRVARRHRPVGGVPGRAPQRPSQAAPPSRSAWGSSSPTA